MKSVVDLFSGCGGMSQGFINAGYNVLAGFELWAPAVLCYKANFSHQLYEFDLSNAKKATEIITGLKGKGDGDDHIKVYRTKGG